MDSLREKMARASEGRKKDIEVNKHLYNKSSADRLLKIIEKKQQTSFIGAISQFEQMFGFLWGHGKPEYDLTDEELRIREKWNLVRNNILNNGNNQIRALTNELSEYTITWNRHQLRLEPSNK